MIANILKKVWASQAGRWVTVGIVTALLSTAGYIWHRHNENLREEGAQECVQEINQATIDGLEAALAAERSAVAQLRANLIAAAAVNKEAEDRRRELSSQLDYLRGTIEEQRENDETYRAWADDALPSGVAGRLRQAHSGEADNGN